MTLSERFAADLAEKFGTTVTVESGAKYDRLVLTDPYRRVHAFVVKATGGLVKAAGWKAPAKGKNGLAVRFDLADEDGYAAALAAADQYGSYLYAR